MSPAPARPSRPRRAALGALAVVAATAATVATIDFRPEDYGSPGILALEARLAPLAERIPPRARVGLVTDGRRVTDGYFAQYVLAPRILGKGPAYDWVIAIAPRVPAARLAERRGLVLVEDAGGGVSLLRGPGRE